MDRMLGKITGRDAIKPPEASEIRKKEDLAFSQTELSPGLEKQWDSKMAFQAQSAEDKAKMDDIRQKIADAQAIQGSIEIYGGKENYLKAVQETTEAIRQRNITKEETERQQIYEQKKAQLGALERKSAELAIDKDLELWQQREAEEKAKRERLDLD